MFVNRSKLFVFGCLFLVLSLCLTGGAYLLMKNQQMYACHNNRPPLKGFVVTIDTSHSKQLVQLLVNYAEKNDFKYEIAYYTPNGENFSVWMEREDLEIVTRSPFTRGEFKIGFYNNDCVNPTRASDITNLVSDLKNHLNEIPNVTITEEK